MVATHVAPVSTIPEDTLTNVLGDRGSFLESRIMSFTIPLPDQTTTWIIVAALIYWLCIVAVTTHMRWQKWGFWVDDYDPTDSYLMGVFWVLLAPVFITGTLLYTLGALILPPLVFSSPRWVWGKK